MDTSRRLDTPSLVPRDGYSTSDGRRLGASAASDVSRRLHGMGLTLPRADGHVPASRYAVARPSRRLFDERWSTSATRRAWKPVRSPLGRRVAGWWACRNSDDERGREVRDRQPDDAGTLAQDNQRDRLAAVLGHHQDPHRSLDLGASDAGTLQRGRAGCCTRRRGHEEERPPSWARLATCTAVPP